MTGIKKKRVSKKTKSSWRKHVNIADVEDFLQGKREEERFFKKTIDEVPTEELCYVDTEGIDARPPVLTSKQAKRTLLRESLPKCFSIMQNDSQISLPISNRNPVGTGDKKKSIYGKYKEQLKRLQRKDEVQRKFSKNKRQKPNSLNDIWDEEKKPDELLDNEWIGDASKRHILQTANEQKRKDGKVVRKKQSAVPAVEPPHPGTSYNPNYEDHQDLLQKVAQRELKIIKAEDHLMRVTTKMFKKVKASVKESNSLKEMSEGLNVKSESEPEEDSKEFCSLNPPVQNKKKTQQQRRKRREQMQGAFEKYKQTKEKKKLHDLRNIKTLNKKVETEQKKAEEAKRKQVEASKRKVEEPKRLTQLRFEEEEIDFNMPQDIRGNLKNLKAEGSLLLSRFKSLQKRNILQPTTYHRMRTAKVKKYEKPGHRSDWKVTVARSKDNML